MSSSFVHPLLHQSPLPAALVMPKPVVRTTEALIYQHPCFSFWVFQTWPYRRLLGFSLHIYPDELPSPCYLVRHFTDIGQPRFHLQTAVMALGQGSCAAHTVGTENMQGW